MSDTVLISLITAIASIVAATLGTISTVLVARTRSDMRVLEKNTNSIKDELVRVTAKAEFAKGLKAGGGASIIGERGPQGEQGPVGPQGPKGGTS